MIYPWCVVQKAYIFQLFLYFTKISWWSSAVCYSFLQTKNNQLALFKIEEWNSKSSSM